MRQGGVTPNWADAHRIAASYGGRLTINENDEIILEVRERLSEAETEQEKKKIADRRGDDAEYRNNDIDAAKTKTPGVTVVLDKKELGMIGFETVEQSEDTLMKYIRMTPDYVSRVLTDVDGKGIFDRSDVDGFIASRITDAQDAADMGDYVLEHDETIVVKTLDTKHPTYVRKELQDLEKHVTERAEKLFAQRDANFDAMAFERSIVQFENTKRDEQLKNNQEPTFKLSDEQRRLCEAVAQNKLSWCNGESGSGKSTSMKVLALYAKETGREIIGVATGQRAAQKLGDEAGIKVYNLAKLMVEEDRGNSLIKPGSIVLIDESSMTSYKSLDRVLRISEARGCNTAAIGDSAQIKNIEAGSPHEVLRKIAAEHDAYVELRTVRRQRGALDWMPEQVSKTGQAIRTGDGSGVAEFINKLDEHGNLTGCEDRDATIKAAAEWFLEKPGVETIISTNDRETAKHGNQMILDSLGLTGTGVKFRMNNGTREMAVGMRLQFQQNLKKDGELYITNGDLGSVEGLIYDDKAKGYKMLVRLDTGKNIVVDPEKYRHIEHGYFLTAFKSQGQSVYRAGCILDKGTSANTAFVQLTRSTDELQGFYAETNFATAGDLGVHLAGRIVEDRDVMLLERTIAKTGGPDTAWAKNVQAALASEKDPLRMRYVAETTARLAAISEKRLEILRAARADLHGDDDMRGEQGSRVAGKTVALDRQMEKLTKTTFVEWAVANKPTIERDAEKIRAIERLREERTREKTISRDTRYKIHDEPEREKSRGYEHER